MSRHTKKTISRAVASRALRPHESWAAWDMGVGHRPGWAEGVWDAGYVRDGRKQKTCAPSKGALGWGSLPQPLHIWAPKKQTKNNTALETVLLGEGSLVPV